MSAPRAPKRHLSQRSVTLALRSILEMGSTFDAMTLNAAGTCLEGEELPKMSSDNVLLLLFDNGQAFEVTVKERK